MKLFKHTKSIKYKIMSVKYESNFTATASCVFLPSLTPFSSLLLGPTILSLVLTILVSVFMIFIQMFVYINNTVLHVALSFSTLS